MKKLLAIYLAICSTAFLCGSCFSDDNDNVETYPFAALTSFSIGSFKVHKNSVTSEGKDTVLTSVVSGSLYPFIIDQKSHEVYNPDSLPMGADVTKLTTGISSDGLAYFYTDSTDTYETVSSADSIDFSKPRNLLIASTNGINIQSYTVRVNVSTIDPDKMYWQSIDKAPVASPVRALFVDGKMMLFGKNGENAPVVALYDGGNWSAETALTPATLNIETIQNFAGCLYTNDESGVLYSSVDGANWSVVSTNIALNSIVAASGSDKLWAVTATDSIAYSEDALNFVPVQALDKNFPRNNISVAVYPLRTNPFILRTLITGYASQGALATPQVWSVLSTEEKWSHYISGGDGTFACPALKPLAMVLYDGMLYAFGGSGKVAGNDVAAFNTIYASNDNGLTWIALAKVDLPAEIAGIHSPFAVAVDADNYLWIVIGGSEPSVWRGRINRLSF